MKLTGGRLALVLLGLVGIVLLGVMIGLQLLIIVGQNQASTTSTEIAAPTQAVAAVTLATSTVAPPTSTIAPATATLEPPTATLAPPTVTLEPPTATLAPPTATLEPPTATLEPPTATLEPPTLTPSSIITTALVVATTASATITPTQATAPTATATSIAPVDLRLGYVDRDEHCQLVTELVALVLEQKLGVTVALVHFNSVDDLFAAVASTNANASVELTFCYIDPDDRSYLQAYGSKIRFVGGHYAENKQTRLYAVSNSVIIVPLKEKHPCVHAFLKNLELGDIETLSQDPTQWLDKNSDRVRDWSQCN